MAKLKKGEEGITNSKNGNTGLTNAEVRALQLEYGKNELRAEKNESMWKKGLSIITEPMFLLLIAAAVIYFILGEASDGITLLVFVLAIITIEFVQEWKTDRTIKALRDLSAPRIMVEREGKEEEIASSELVPGDIMMIREGVRIPADGYVIRCNDLCIDESSLTGESEAVWKQAHDEYVEVSEGYWRNDHCYAGSTVIQGSAVVRVTSIGNATEYGKIGADIAEAPKVKTPLQKQIGIIVKASAVIAAALFVLLSAITWFSSSRQLYSERLIDSILSGITLAMAMIPEEYPVIFTVFLSMGAWRLAAKRTLVRKLPAVETLGAVSVLCVDKTGTITMNRMQVSAEWAADGDEDSLVEIMGLACETETYDPMEEAMLAHCEREHRITKEHLFGGRLISEYSFTHALKMMGHIWHHDGSIIIAAKGSPEQILTICQLSLSEREYAEEKVLEMSAEGLRVIAVATTTVDSEGDIPARITDCRLRLSGLIGLSDPPRESVSKDIACCYRAGIRVVMITGDHAITASSIAKSVGMADYGNTLSGEMLENMSAEELAEAVKSVSIFTRLLPEHKMRIVRALQENGEVVAMTGDGVNDAAALKYADIGIAMGKSGSEVSREAADLILLDDNFTTIVETVRDGRRIFDNIRKAAAYVLTIHLPIALASIIAPVMGIAPDAVMFLPTIVVLLELLIDPTCSVVLERQPAELNIMERNPRKATEKLLSAGILCKSMLQGLTVFTASFGVYYYMLRYLPEDTGIARTMGLGVLLIANLFLVQVNSSDTVSIFTSVRILSRDKVMWAVNAAVVAAFFLIVYTPINSFLSLSPLSLNRLLIVILLGAASVIWYEAVKLLKRLRYSRENRISN